MASTRDALADLAGDELVELTGIPAERAQELIMKARTGSRTRRRRLRRIRPRLRGYAAR
jgi:hypothetical protein